ncbi:MAG: hypothetical protein RMJ87_10845 [Cytophagales bacterium]|nr:hypothetical protein [Cytophagales bacterium]
MKRLIYLILFAVFSASVASCVHAPHTGWTPRKSKPIRTGKPIEYTKVNKRLRMW